MPARIQLSRRKGFRLPEGAVTVARPSRWGNPYRVVPDRPWPEDPPDWLVTHPKNDPAAGEHPFTFVDKARAVECAVASFRHDLGAGFLAFTRSDVKRELRGKDLACWCPLDQECHADVLIEVANG